MKDMLKIGPDQLALLEKLCNAVGVSGAEGEVRRIVLAELKGVADEITVDAMGNVLARRNAKPGTPHPLNVMLDAHMDEVGFMIAADDGDGIYSFEVVGGVDKRQLPGKTVLVGKDHLPGVIGTKPIHLHEDGEGESAIPLSSLRIDLGPAGAGKVQPGDTTTFATRFLLSGDSIFAKAIDDRIGVASIIELLRHAPDHLNLLASFSVQEEIGLRGAKVAAYTFNPDLAIALDSTPAHDLPREDGEENAVYNCRLGAGPAIYLSDAGTISDPRLLRHLTAVAAKYSIPYQFRQPGGGGTNAGSIHRQRSGIPSVSISVPGRYAHTAILLSRVDDWQNSLNLVYQALNNLTPEILANPRD
jgi:tetrahedral aminopeptidase